VEASEEIRNVVRRWIAATGAGDADSVLGRLADHPGALSIGTDAEEWWHGEEASAVWQRQFEEMRHRGFEPGPIEAWEEGTVGWAATRIRVDLGDETRDARLTCVLHLERDEWKIVQHHTSFAQPNETVFGAALTVSLEQLEQAVRRERPDLAAARAADGTVTIVFTDIVDSTVLNARLGDHAWRDVLLRHREVVAQATESSGGSVVETIGDGSMLAFPSARRAIACAQEIQRALDQEFRDASPPIKVRIGAHTGEALRDGDAFFGATLNYAARVASHALGGEILVSRLTRELVEGGAGIRFRESREVELKGLPGTHTLFAIDLR
jgi:class 3 adenylate cyclase/ketosteroid isomerase-like protein